VRPTPLREPSVNSRTTHKILSILGNGIIHSVIAGVRFLQRAKNLNFWHCAIVFED